MPNVTFTNDISDYYYPITGNLIGKAHPRTTVDPMIVSPIYSDSDADTILNTDRPKYLFGDNTSALPLYTHPTTTHHHRHASQMRHDPTYRNPYVSYISSDIHVQSVPIQYARPYVASPTTPGQQTNRTNMSTNTHILPNEPRSTFKDLPIHGYGIGQTKPPVYNQTESTSVYQQSHTTEDSVYDPRTYGFGDERRFVVDPVTGAPDWNYDDVDAARIPQYITRSDVDAVSLLDNHGYASVPVGLNQVHQYMDNTFIDQTNQARAELMEGYTRKYREQREWQLREMPVRSL